MRFRGWGAATLALAVSMTACGEGLADLNVSPNDPVEVGAEYLFPNAVEAAVSRVVGTGLTVDLTGLWAQHFAEFEIALEDVHQVEDSRVSTHWSGFYAGPLQDLQEVIEQGREDDRPNTEAMGMIMKAWTAQVVTDLWGDIGYSEALRGRDADIGLEVSYDTQREVYLALLSETAMAADLIEAGGVTIPASADLIYGSDMEQWRRFANSLRMRLAMRLSEVESETAAAEFQDAYGDGGFESNDDGAVLWYIDNGVNRHPVFVLYQSPIKHSVSATMVDTLQSLNDPRLAVYAELNGAGVYRGAPNGTVEHEDPASVSLIGDFYSSADSPGILMSYAELLFLEAEAAERGWITADAGERYEAGIRAAMEFNGVAEQDIVDYLAQAEIAYQGDQAGLEQIWLQKWIALYGNGPEAYSEWRRTGVPGLVPGPDAEGEIPLRLFYPESEMALNRDAVEEAQARQGDADLTDPVWWDN